MVRLIISTVISNKIFLYCSIYLYFYLTIYLSIYLSIITSVLTNISSLHTVLTQTDLVLVSRAYLILCCCANSGYLSICQQDSYLSIYLSVRYLSINYIWGRLYLSMVVLSIYLSGQTALKTTKASTIRRHHNIYLSIYIQNSSSHRFLVGIFADHFLSSF